MRVFRDGDGRGGHDLRNLAAVLVNEVARRLASAENESQQSAAPALCPDFTPTNEISFRDDTNQLAGCIDHWKAADVPSEHQVCRVSNRHIRPDCNDRFGHYLMSAHVGLHSV